MPTADANIKKIVTKNVVNGVLTITDAMGVVAFSVASLNTSTTNGTLNGNTTLGGLNSEDIDILPASSKSVSAPHNNTISGFTITSPDVNCLLEVILIVGSNT